MKKFILYCGSFLFIILCFCILYALTNTKKHDFESQCAMCHVNIPANETNVADIVFTDEITTLCAKCHPMKSQKSHPVKFKPNRDIPLKAHLDKNGFLTCATCHDIHKENKTSNKAELSGFLWGHMSGRAFCELCHNKETLYAGWKHQTALPYAHSYGKLLQENNGRVLDSLSVECLSCHDGTISQAPQVQVTQGIWQHQIGESHPIGIEYPRSEDFVAPESLPEGVQLFEGKIGCLTCHEMFSQENNKLSMNNTRSRLCLACHKK